MKVTKTFASWKVFVYVLLYSHQHRFFFQAPTFWNWHLHKRLLPDEVFQWWQFFVFKEQALLIFHLLFSFHVKFKQSSKTLKYSEQYIQDNLSDTKVSIWICFEHDAVFNFSCIVLCNLTKSFTFSSIYFYRNTQTLFHQYSNVSSILHNIYFPSSQKHYETPSIAYGDSFLLHIWKSCSPKIRVCLIFFKVIQILNSAVSGEMLQAAFNFQIFVKVTYARHFFNLKCVLQMFT